MYKYKIRKRDVDINIPLNLAAMMAFWGLAAFMGFELNWAAGISLLLVFVVLLILSNEYNYFDHRGRPVSNFKPLIMIISLGLLIFSGKLCINSIVSISVSLGISESILGYFLLALGTSLPELITTLVAVKNHDGEMGIGSILGSNLFNLLFVVGISTFIRPLVLIDFKNDLLFLTGATLAAFVFAVAGKRYSFDRREGWGLLVIYAVFMIFQVVKG